MNRTHRAELTVILPGIIVVGLLVGCSVSPTPAPSSGSTGTSVPRTSTAPTQRASAPSAGGTTPPATAPSPAPFMSSHYRYAVASADWTGSNAATAWDGTGGPGDTDPTVDVLRGPQGEQAYAFGEPTTAPLNTFVAHLRTMNARVHPCRVQPANTTSITVDGEPAILDQERCPPTGGPFVVTAYMIHEGRGYAFFTYSIPPGSGPFTRSWFRSLLTYISFTQ
jgi:hypothetical protein